MTAGTKWSRMALLAVLCAAPACSTTNLEELAPASTAPAVAPGPAAANAPSLSQPGDYPNLNIIPVPAAEQFTDAQRDAEAAALRARRQQLTGGGAVADRSEELRRLARSHADDAIKVIEAE